MKGAVLLVVLAGPLAALELPAPEEVFILPGDRIVARVGGIPITSGLLVRRAYPDLVRLMQTRAAGLQSGGWSDANERQFRDYWNLTMRQALAIAIRDELLYSLAKKSNLVASASLVEKVAEDKISRLGGDNALKEMGVTVEDVKKEVEKELVVDTVMKTRRPPTAARGPREIRRFYEENTGAFTLSVPGLRIRVIAVPEKTREGGDNRATAEKIGTAAESAASFAALAAKHSVHRTKNSGGLFTRMLASGVQVDVVSEEHLPESIRGFAAVLEEGRVHGPVAAEGHYWLILLEKRFSAGLLPFESVATPIAGFLNQMHEAEATARWITRLAEKAGIVDGRGAPLTLDDIIGAPSQKEGY